MSDNQHLEHMEHDRGTWGSNFGFLMAAVGSAVGLGNIWGFPYKMGNKGGFAFLVIYLLLVIFVGVVVMLGELTIGRKTGKGAVGAYAALSKKYKWVGYLGILSAFTLLAFYNVLGGLVMRYMFGFLLQILGVDGFSGAEGILRLHTLRLQRHDFLPRALHRLQRGDSHGRHPGRHREVLHGRNAGALLHAPLRHHLRRLPAGRRRGLQVHAHPQLRAHLLLRRLHRRPEDGGRPDVLLAVAGHGRHNLLRLLPG